MVDLFSSTSKYVGQIESMHCEMFDLRLSSFGA